MVPQGLWCRKLLPAGASYRPVVVRQQPGLNAAASPEMENPIRRHETRIHEGIEADPSRLPREYFPPLNPTSIRAVVRKDIGVFLHRRETINMNASSKQPRPKARTTLSSRGIKVPVSPGCRVELYQLPEHLTLYAPDMPAGWESDRA